MLFSKAMNCIRRAGGVKKYVSMWIRKSFKPLWGILQSIPVFNYYLNQFYLCSVLKMFDKTVPRIPRHTLVHDNLTMDVLYDESKTTYSRLLPRQPKYTKSLPELEKVAALFQRKEFTPEKNQNLSLLVGYYAQWFSHQFFNTNQTNPVLTNQPVGINLGQLYGSTADSQNSMRTLKGGLLKSSVRHGQEFPEILPAEAADGPPGLFQGKEVFRFPIPLANMIPGFAAIHVIFFRRHQHVARELGKWAKENGVPLSDEDIYQKAKIIVSFNVLQITMHDYVARSLQSSYVKIRFDANIKRSFIYRWFGPKTTYPINAIQTEFNFLYRWHQFYPDSVKTLRKLPADTTGSKPIDWKDADELEFPSSEDWLGSDWNAVTALTETPDALERVLFSAAHTRAGKLQLRNTQEWLAKHVVARGLAKGRTYELASYNDYREHFGFGRLTSFDQVTSDPALREQLKAVYESVDQIEYYVGIFAEDKDFGGIHGPFLATIGVGMTYSGIFASRLFDVDVLNAEVLTPCGLKMAQEINYISDMTERHTKLSPNTYMRFTVPSGVDT